MTQNTETENRILASAEKLFYQKGKAFHLHMQLLGELVDLGI